MSWRSAIWISSAAPDLDGLACAAEPEQKSRSPVGWGGLISPPQILPTFQSMQITTSTRHRQITTFHTT